MTTGEKLRIAEDILSEQGLDWCDGCDDYTGTSYQMTLKAGWDGPEEGFTYCDDCGYRRDF